MIFSLAFLTNFGYNTSIARERITTFRCFPRGENEKILLRNLAPIYIQQKAYFDSGNCELYCFVLISFGFFVFMGRSVLNGFFYAHRELKHLTHSAHQIMLIKISRQLWDF